MPRSSVEHAAPAISRTKWYEILADFSWDPDEAEQRWVDTYSWEQLLVELLRAFSTEKDLNLRMQLLIFLEERASGPLLLSGDPTSNLNRVAQKLNHVLTAPVDGANITYSLKGQVLVTTTVLLIELDAVKLDPGLLESFVDLLYSVVQNINSSGDRELRGLACESLRELEWAYPCLLSAGLGNLFKLAQGERTHVAGAYTLLYATVLENSVMHLCFVPGPEGGAVTPPASPMFPSQVAAGGAAVQGAPLTFPSVDLDLVGRGLTVVIVLQQTPCASCYL
eukprot:gene13048-15415_t